MNKFKNERKKSKSLKLSVEAAVEEVGTALSGAAIATILAFLAFLLGSMPEMNRFGLLMSIGVGASFLLSIFGLPAFLIVEEKIIYRLKNRMKFGVEGELKLEGKK
jgi:predicted RND superfamily exporter protein